MRILSKNLWRPPLAGRIGTVAIAAVVVVAGCAPSAVLTISGPDDMDDPIAPLSAEGCTWYRSDADTIRLVVDYRQLRSAGIWWASGVRPKRITLVIDIPADSEQTGPATGQISAETLCGMDLTRSGVMYVLGESGQIDWHIDAENQLVASLRGVCRAYPYKFRPDERLTELYDLTARLTATHDPAATRRAAKEVLLSVRH